MAAQDVYVVPSVCWAGLAESWGDLSSPLLMNWPSLATSRAFAIVHRGLAVRKHPKNRSLICLSGSITWSRGHVAFSLPRLKNTRGGVFSLRAECQGQQRSWGALTAFSGLHTIGSTPTAIALGFSTIFVRSSVHSSLSRARWRSFPVKLTF